MQKTSGIPEFKKCAATYRRWFEEIKNAFKYGYSNGPTEGFNNKIKVLKVFPSELRTFIDSVIELFTVLINFKYHKIPTS